MTAINPTSGRPSQTVTLTGTGFDTTVANNIVRFGSTTATVTAATATTLTVTAPSAGSGTVSVTATVNGQTSPGGVNFTFID
ncbi:IPT/TIG domain-containing protein, partial [Enterococcus faecium]|uniref:IPT/TIG domain-containing protein n=1 Tax=Enterococcus faecium TaxID=1352 RepID=UPI003F51B766